MKRSGLDSGGLTIVELLVAIAVAAVVTTTLSSVTTSYIHVAQSGRDLNLANAYVEAKVEALRNAGYSTLTNGTTSLTTDLPSQLPLGKSASMTISDKSAGIKQVDITISYKDQGTKSYSYTTYIGELGVGQ